MHDSRNDHDRRCNISGGAYSVELPANKTYSFVYLAGDSDDQFSSNVTIKNTTNYNFSRNNSDAITLQTAAAGSYKFSFSGYDGGQTSMSVRVEFPPEDPSTTTWTAVGDSTALFGTAWAPTATANDLEKGSGTTWSKTWNGVQLTGGSTIKYKVAKNHAWTTTYPSSNATATVPGTGTGMYNVTVTYNESGNAVNMELQSAATYTLTVDSVENAVVKATYNGTTANEGGTISNIPQGATVSVSVTPDTGYQCSGITSSGGGTTAGSLYSFTLTMPGENTTVGATLGTVTLKRIYFNNSYTLYGQVYAYAYNKDGPTKTYECLGAYPGTTMTKLDNSNIWYIEVPSDVDYVEFTSGEGYSTSELQIPWDKAYPKYTAPYGHNYIYGSDNKRTNECTVSDGNTMSASNLFTGITATMYDYYTDSEVTGGWLNIAADEYSKGTNASGWKWNPYTKLNTALSEYANNTVQPTYDVATPLYFGNLNTIDGGANLVSGYYHWQLNPNNSVNLNPGSTAITGLSGKTLANDTIHYYNGSDANENGAPMAMFDEDFLSGENKEGQALATILRTSSFPVRKEENVGGSVTGISKLYLSAGTTTWGDENAVMDAYFYAGSTPKGWVQMSYDSSSGYYVTNSAIPSGSTGVIFTRSSQHISGWGDSRMYNQSENLSLTLSGSNAKNVYTCTGFNSGKGTFSASLDTSLSGCTTTGGHTYYEFDSTDGKDNAYITNLSDDKKTANIDYYYDDAVWSGGTAENTKGFFPFDYAHKGYGAEDLGFGIKLVIPFNLTGSGDQNGINEDGTPQTFDFSGDDDLWVFVDGKLVLDLGGAHGRTTGSINFQDKTVTATQTQKNGTATRNGSFGDGFNTNANYVHTMTIYYMERGMLEPNLKFGFSFHAIPNQFWIDKKIRTKDIINAGFYQYNDQEGTASNQDDTLTAQQGRFISKFEASYQNEQFTVEHKYGDTAAGATTPAAGKNYTIDNDTNTYTTPEAGTYPIKHNLGNAFIGQFETGQYFNLKETYGTGNTGNTGNKYVYTPKFSVWDQANNDKAVTYTVDDENGYTFRFNPTTNVTTGIENTNIKARFENFMKAHSLTLTKKTNNPNDTESEFTMKIMFDFENDGNYIAYPLYCDLNGVRTQLSKTGEINIKAGQILEIEEIPENAKIQVTELPLGNTSPYTYYGTDVTDMAGGAIEGATAAPDGNGNGVRFTMGSDDMKATVNNAQADPVMIFHDLKPRSVGEADTYVTAVVTNEAGTETKVTYDKTPGRITIDPQYLKKDSTDKIVITLDTTPIGPYAFESFWEDIRSTMEELTENGVKYTATIDTARMTAEVKIVIGDLFNEQGVQLYTELPFYSSLEDLQRSLTITKKLTTGTDADTAFTVNVTKNGAAYTGAYKLNGTAATTSDGIFTMHQNDTITIEGLHVGENVAVYETDIPFNYQFSKATLGTDDATNVASGDATGYAFTVREDTALTIWNALIEYQYELTYSYSSYRNLHQTQKYKYSGTFNANTDKVNTYLTVSDQVPDADNHGNTCTAYWFKDDNARKNFINILGPYENNYMKLLYWNTDMRSNSNPNGVSIVYTSTNHKYTIDVNATVSEDNYVDLHFKFPYAHDVRGNGYAAIETDGKVVEDTTQETEDIPNLDYMTWYAVNNYKSYEEAAAHDTVPQFVAAPKVIYDGDTPKYFRYWTVKTVPTDNDYQGVEYTKCYYYEFNLTIYQDSIVEPVYKALTAEEVAAGYTPSPHAEAIKDGNANGAVVTFIENSRNRYNVYNSNVPAETRRSKGDRIYNDFLLSYASESDLQYRTFDEGTYTAGIAIQRVARLDTNGDDVITDTAYYAEKYGSSTDTMTFVAPGTDTKTAFNKTVLQNFVKGNATYNDDFGLESSQFDATRLDNKNRIQYYYSYSIKSHSDLTVDTGNKDYVYRAFAYMIDNTTHEIELLSEAPLYYTFYDMASIANAQDGYEIDFPSDP